MPVTTLPDGSTEYAAPCACADVRLNGASILACQPIEIRVWPDGWGYAATLIEIDSGLNRVQADGTRRVYTRHGALEVMA